MLSAQDWTQWRGPARDGKLSSFAPPSSWPQELLRGWSVEVGIGYASPLVAGNRAYVFARRAEDEVASALDLETGRVLWRESYTACYALNPAATSHGKGPKSTPVLAGGRLYTLGISGILTCRDAGTGRTVWRKDFASEFRATSPLYGAATSPVVDGGLLIAHVGCHDQGALMAFDAGTGEPKWRWTGDGPGYASPIVVELSAVRQVVTASQDKLVGVSASDGTLLWSVPFSTNYTQNAVTPVLFEDTVIFSGLEKGVLAIRPVKHDSGWVVEKAWESPSVSLYMSSPVLVGKLLFGLSHRNKGQFFVLDPVTGVVLRTGAARQGENAAVLTNGEHVFILTNDAELIVVNVGGHGFDVVKRYTVAQSPTWAHPVLLGKHILVKDHSSLTLWTLP